MKAHFLHCVHRIHPTACFEHCSNLLQIENFLSMKCINNCNCYFHYYVGMLFSWQRLMNLEHLRCGLLLVLICMLSKSLCQGSFTLIATLLKKALEQVRYSIL